MITLNLNRIVQDWVRGIDAKDRAAGFIAPNCFRWFAHKEEIAEGIKAYLVDILERVYKYHTAYKTILYEWELSLIHISEPTRQAEISYAVFCLKKKKKQKISQSCIAQKKNHG